MNQKYNKLKKIANEIRYETIKLVHESKTVHLGSSLSCVDILVVSYFSDNGLKKRVNNLKNVGETFILSKGHAAPALYVVLQKKKYFSKKTLNSYAKPNSFLEEHPNIKINGVLVSSGSLGHGLSYAAGLSLGDRINKKNNKHVVLMSDGECNEGTVWEAAMFITGKKLKNIIALIDCNKWQATQRTNEILKIEPLKDKWKSFGWKVQEINGHNIKSIDKVFYDFKKNPVPTAVICRTIKGRGVSFMEDDNLWHYRTPNREEFLKAKSELKIK
ncbi:transketolase [Pelagibacteraceae bacterium]|nr:transketolase [Pelagibacteraceae bacterium]